MMSEVYLERADRKNLLPTVRAARALSVAGPRAGGQSVVINL